MLKKFYEDNLINTGNSIEVLSDLYTRANKLTEKVILTLDHGTGIEESLKIKDKKIRRAWMWAWKSFGI